MFPNVTFRAGVALREMGTHETGVAPILPGALGGAQKPGRQSQVAGADENTDILQVQTPCPEGRTHVNPTPCAAVRQSDHRSQTTTSLLVWAFSALPSY